MNAKTAETRVNQAAMWVADQSCDPPNILLLVKRRFDLSSWQAAQACQLGRRYRMLRRAFG